MKIDKLYILLFSAILFASPGIAGVKGTPCKCTSYNQINNAANEIEVNIVLSPVKTCCCTKQPGHCDISKKESESNYEFALIISTGRIKINNFINDSFTKSFFYRARVPDNQRNRHLINTTQSSRSLFIQNTSLLC